jgi:aryl-alcohol dehydrogenase-like predicted oxidoreductase
VTKGGHPEFRDLHYSRLAPECLEFDINTSLAVLDVDYIDVYFLHRDDERIPVGEIMDALDQFVGDGLCKVLGASNWTTKRIMEANEYALKHNKTPFSISQVQWSIAHCPQEALPDQTTLVMADEDYANYLKMQMPAMAYSSQANGFFSKLISGGEAALKPRNKQIYWNETNVRRAKVIEQVCKELNCSPTALTLAYITCNPLDAYAIIGSARMEQLEDSLSAADLEIDHETIKRIMEY